MTPVTPGGRPRMEITRSADGTRIAFDRTGDGPPAVLVVGAFCDRRTAADLAALLAPGLTVVTYDRRGRGDSDDATAGPDAADREIEDLAAVIDAAGGPVALYGHSSGAVLALRAVHEGLPVSRVAAYEPPWEIDESDPTFEPRVRAAIAEDRLDDAVRLFVSHDTAPLDWEDSPAWPALRALAPTLPFELALVGGPGLPDWLPTITVPALVLDGSESDDWARRAVAEVAAAVPGARRHTVVGQGHGVAADAVAPVLREFLPARS